MTTWRRAVGQGPVHPPPTLAPFSLLLQNLHSDFFPKMITNIGFVIEGRDDSELPEQMLGCAKLVNMNKEDAIDEGSFFGG